MPAELLPVILLLLVLALVFAGMFFGWRARSRRHRALSVLGLPPGLGQPLLEAGILYVATTTAGDPLDRVTLPGLTFRGRGRLLVWPDGVAFSVNGEREVYIPVEAVKAVGTSTWTIDRAVEPGGLVRIDWLADSGTPAGTATDTGLSAVAVESYFRVLEAEERGRVMAALQRAVPVRTEHGEGEEER